MKKPRFNIIDLIIILVIIVACIVGAYAFKGTESAPESDKEEKIVFSLKQSEASDEIKAYYEENIKQGDKITVGKTKKEKATVENIEIVPSKVVYDNPQSGEKSTVDAVDKYDIVITVSAKAKDTKKAYLLGDMEIKVGKVVEFEKKDAEGKLLKSDGVVLMLNEAEAAEDDK